MAAQEQECQRVVAVGGFAAVRRFERDGGLAITARPAGLEPEPVEREQRLCKYGGKVECQARRIRSFCTFSNV